MGVPAKPSGFPLYLFPLRSKRMPLQSLTQRGCYKKISISKIKENNKNQRAFERIMIMEYELIGIGRVKMTVGIRRRTREKIQYCITAISTE